MPLESDHKKQVKFGNDFQPRGAAILVLNKLSYNITWSGDNPLSLGHVLDVGLKYKELFSPNGGTILTIQIGW